MVDLKIRMFYLALAHKIARTIFFFHFRSPCPIGCRSGAADKKKYASSR
jgi:hypothetical protein